VTFDAARSEGGGTSADFVITVAVPIAGDRAVFTVLQTYSDGQVVRWGTDPAKEPNEPDLAPVLQIEGGATTTTLPTTTSTTVAAAESSGTGLKMPGTGSIFIAIGVAVIVAVVMRTRRMNRRK
jgi:hypothetical protein